MFYLFCSHMQAFVILTLESCYILIVEGDQGVTKLTTDKYPMIGNKACLSIFALLV